MFFYKFLFIIGSLHFGFCETKTTKIVQDAVVNTGKHFGSSSDLTLTVLATIGCISIVGVIVVGGIKVYKWHNPSFKDNFKDNFKDKLLENPKDKIPFNQKPSNIVEYQTNFLVNEAKVVGTTLDSTIDLVEMKHKLSEKHLDRIENLQLETIKELEHLETLQLHMKKETINFNKKQENLEFVFKEQFIKLNDNVTNIPKEYISEIHKKNLIKLNLEIYELRTTIFKHSLSFVDVFLNKIFHGRVTVDCLLTILSTLLQNVSMGSMTLWALNEILLVIDCGVQDLEEKVESQYTVIVNQIHLILSELKSLLEAKNLEEQKEETDKKNDDDNNN